MKHTIATFDLRNIKSTVIFILVIGLFITGIASYFFPTKEVLNGVLFGIFVGIFNYVAFVFLIKKFIRPSVGATGRSPLRIGLLLILKMLSLFGLVAMGLTVFDLNLLAFVVGYLSLILACLFQVVAGGLT